MGQKHVGMLGGAVTAIGDGMDAAEDGGMRAKNNRREGTSATEASRVGVGGNAAGRVDGEEEEEEEEEEEQQMAEVSIDRLVVDDTAVEEADEEEEGEEALTDAAMAVGMEVDAGEPDETPAAAGKGCDEWGDSAADTRSTGTV